MAPAKLETDLHVKVVAEAFYEAVSEKAYELTNISPLLFKEAVLVEGEWGKKGSIIFWRKYVNGKVMEAKDLIEEVDRNNKAITYKKVEGDHSVWYKNFKTIIKVTEEEEDGGSVVHLSFEYEKVGDDVPDPYAVMYLFIQLTKDIEYHLLKS